METSSGSAKTNSPQASRRRMIVAVVMILAALLIGAWAWTRMKFKEPDVTNTSSGTPFTAPTEMCEPEDVQQCPDGTFIHRELPDCELPACPNSNN